MVRVAARSDYNEGDRVNLFDGKDANGVKAQSGRVSFRYLPSDRLQIDLNVHAHVDRSDFKQGKPIGTFPGNTNVLGYADPFPRDSRKLNFNGKNKHDIDAQGTVLTIQYDIGKATLKSITAYEDSETEYCGDFDHSPLSLDEICFETDGEQFSQEINVNMNLTDGMDLVAGAFYLTEDLRYDTFANLFGELPVGLALPLRAGEQGHENLRLVFRSHY